MIINNNPQSALHLDNASLLVLLKLFAALSSKAIILEWIVIFKIKYDIKYATNKIP